MTETETSPVLYSAERPEWLDEFCALPEMQRLKHVGMNCGCEYTSFPRFRGLPKYSRYRHSVGAALIVWHFTGSMAQTLAGLFHDIATPVFAHTVDFLYGDYMAQEHTEGRTGELIRGSEGITRLLDKYNIAPDAVTDYHIYPVADNDSPRLSADRLEYTLGNLAAYTGRTAAELQAYYDDLCVAVNEHGETELSFTGADMAYRFAHDALEMSRIYVSDEDRYAMQMLSELLGQAIKKGVLSAEELYLTEETVIEKLMSDAETAKLWRGYCALHEIVTDREAFPDGAWRVIGAKKRRIDPFVRGAGRLSEINAQFAGEIKDFMDTPLDRAICARTRPTTGRRLWPMR